MIAKAAAAVWFYEAVACAGVHPNLRPLSAYGRRFSTAGRVAVVVVAAAALTVDLFADRLADWTMPHGPVR